LRRLKDGEPVRPVFQGKIGGERTPERGGEKQDKEGKGRKTRSETNYLLLSLRKDRESMKKT